MTKSKLTSFERAWIMFWGERGECYGVSKNATQIAARLFLLNKAQSAEDLSRDLGIARSTLAIAVREAVGTHMVKSMRPVGERKELFVSAISDAPSFIRWRLNRRIEFDLRPTMEGLIRLHGEAPPKVGEAIMPMLSIVTWEHDRAHQLLAMPNDELMRYMDSVRSGAVQR